MNNYWFRRRWMDGRTGHSIYLLFALSMINFIIIIYRFLIEKDPLFENLISDLWVFAIIFLASYIPISIVIGHWHRKTQLSVHNTIKYLENPFFSKMFRVLLDAKTGRATKEEIEKFHKTLSEIERK